MEAPYFSAVAVRWPVSAETKGHFDSQFDSGGLFSGRDKKMQVG
jgi:hypothetical protein